MHHIQRVLAYCVKNLAHASSFGPQWLGFLSCLEDLHVVIEQLFQLQSWFEALSAKRKTNQTLHTTNSKAQSFNPKS